MKDEKEKSIKENKKVQKKEKNEGAGRKNETEKTQEMTVEETRTRSLTEKTSAKMWRR